MKGLPPHVPARVTLVFDNDCNTCSKFAALVKALDTRRRITFVSIHDREVESRLRPVLGPAYDQSFHLVHEPAGRVVSGESALADLAGLLPALRPFGDLVFRTPFARRVPAALYRALARDRTCPRRAAAA